MIRESIRIVLIHHHGKTSSISSIPKYFNDQCHQVPWKSTVRKL